MKPRRAPGYYARPTQRGRRSARCAGFWLIPAVGLRTTTWVGIALNVCSAGGVVAGVTTIKAETAAPPRRTKRNNRATIVTWIPRAARDGGRGHLGFTALVYEVCWTRLLALVIGPTTCAFTTVVASFIIGVAIGSAAGADSSAGRHSR
jgi:spermidine synthase